MIKRLSHIIFLLSLLNSLYAVSITSVSRFGHYDSLGTNSHGNSTVINMSAGGHKLVTGNAGTMHAVFTNTGSTPKDQLFYAKSIGGSWSAGSVLSSFDFINNPSVAVDGDNVYIAFYGYTGENTLSTNADYVPNENLMPGHSNHQLGIWLMRSDDNGVSFKTPVLIREFLDTIGMHDYYDTDIIFTNGQLYVAARGVKRHWTIPSSTPYKRNLVQDINELNFVELLKVSSIGLNSATVINTFTNAFYPALSKDNNGDIYLAYEQYTTNYGGTPSTIQIRKYNSGGSQLASTSISPGGSAKVQHVNLVNDSAGNLYVAYSRDIGGSMTLAYRKYNSNLDTVLQSSDNITSGPAIYSPQIGLADNADAPNGVIPVIQYVRGTLQDLLAGNSNIYQVSQMSTTNWSTPDLRNPNGLSHQVFPHMLKNIVNDQPQTLYWDPNTSSRIGTVYFDPFDDKIAPWQPPVPTVRWADQGLNSGNTQRVSASITAMPARAAQIYYDWDGNGTSDTAYSANLIDTKTNVYDRQQVRASIKARDANNNESVSSNWSGYVAIHDRTRPVGSVTINNNAVYTNTANINLQLSYGDNNPNATNQSGVNKVTIGGSVTVTGDTTLTTTVPQVTNTLAKTLIAVNGLKTVSAFYTDVSENFSTTYTDDIYLDTQVPSGAVTLLNSINNEGQLIVGSGNVSFRFDYNDVLKDSYASGLEKISLQVNNGTVSTNIGAPVTAGGANGTFTLNLTNNSAFTFNTLGPKSVTVNFIDYAGNQKTVTLSFDLRSGAIVTTANSSVTINNGAMYTNTINVKLSLESLNAVSMNISNYADFSVSTNWLPYAYHNNDYPWSLLTGDGLKTVYVKYRDTLGNEVMVTDDIILDTQAPSGDEILVPGGSSAYGVVINNDAEWTNTLNVTLTLKATDNIAVTSMNISNTPNTLGNWYPYSETFSNWLLVNDGNVTKTVYVIYMDAAGNTSNVVTDDIKYDNGRPTGDIGTDDKGHLFYGVVINDDDEWTNSLYVTLNISATNNISPVTSMNISNTLNVPGNWYPYSETFHGWVLSEGGDPVTKTVYVIFMNAAGSTSNVVTDSIKYNNTRPTGDIVTGTSKYGIVINNDDQWTTSLLVTLNISATSNVSPVVSMSIRNADGFSIWGAWQEYTTIIKNWPLSSAGDPVTKTVEIRFIDAAGNISNMYFDDIKYDNGRPTGDIITGTSKYGIVINNNAEWTNTLNVTLNISATSNISSVTEMRLSNYSDLSGGTGWIAYETITTNWQLRTDGDPVTKIVYVQFRNAAGNTSNIYSDDIKYDNTSPTGNEILRPDGSKAYGLVINNDDEWTGSLYVTLNISATSSLSPVVSMNIRNADGSWTGWQPYTTISRNWLLDSGHDPVTKTVEIMFMNAAGNTSNIYLDTIKYTTERPTGDIGTDGNGNSFYGLVINDDDEWTTSLLVTLNISATSNIAEVTSMSIRNSDGSWSAWVKYATIYNWTLSSGGDPVTKTVEIRFMNAAGNISDVYSDDIKYDNTNSTVTDSGNTGEDIYSYPNPFKPSENDEVSIGFWVKADGWYKVYIYNIRGERVWQQETYAHAGKENLVRWNGRTPYRQIAPNGIYILMSVSEKNKIIAKGRMSVID